jgi:hypothetical protein
MRLNRWGTGALTLSLAGLWASSFAFDAHAALPPYDSATQKVVGGVIDDGEILVKSDTSDPEPLIREQLKYMLGQINWEDAAPKLFWFDVEVGERSQVDPASDLVTVHYKAHGHVAWSRDQELPSEMELILPARGDQSGLESFVNRYFNACTNDPLAERDGYFFFFYPKLKTCPMSHPSDHELEREKGMVVRFPMHFEENDTNTHDKSPEYERLWKDHKLTVTAIFSKFKPDGVDNSDEGVRAYHQFYSTLLSHYGQPRYQERDRGATRLSWNMGDKKLEVHLRLVSKLAQLRDSFHSWYRERTKTSDVVMYSGHAGLGDNIDVLVQDAEFEPNRYQIFFLNGCDTFSYFGNELFKAHGEVNPGSAPSKYLDVVTNSTSVYFNQMARESFIMMDELVRGNKTYREILRRMDPKQRAIVDGEEDNP